MLGPSLIRRWACAAGLAGLLLGGSAFAGSDANMIEDEYAVKVVFFVKLAKFVEWPDGAFADDSAPFTVCVAGPDPFGGLLDEAAKDEIVRNRSVQVKRVALTADLRACHIVFFSRSSSPKIADVLDTLRSTHTLTVTEDENATRHEKGAINFLLVDKKVRFEIHPLIAESKLEISSKLRAISYQPE